LTVYREEQREETHLSKPFMKPRIFFEFLGRRYFVEDIPSKDDSISLDVGCGTRPHGDINVDIGPTQTNTHPRNLRTRANVYADGCYLPFKDGAFGDVYSFDVIEHVPDPVKFVRELERVGGRITIVTPHRFAPNNNRNPTHIYGFNRTWFTRLGYDVQVTWVSVPFLFFFSIQRVGNIWATKTK